MNYSELLQLAKGWGNFKFYRGIIWRLQWDKAFWARGYYVSTIGNITEDAIKKYIKEQAEESRREDSRSTAL